MVSQRRVSCCASLGERRLYRASVLVHPDWPADQSSNHALPGRDRIPSTLRRFGLPIGNRFCHRRAERTSSAAIANSDHCDIRSASRPSGQFFVTRQMTPSVLHSEGSKAITEQVLARRMRDGASSIRRRRDFFWPDVPTGRNLHV